MNRFSTKEAIGFGWTNLKAHWKFLLVIGLISILGSVVPNVMPQVLANQSVLIRLLLTIAAWIFSVILSMGVINIMLMFVDGKMPQLTDLFTSAHLFIKFILAQILMLVVLFIGYMLFIIPGIIFSVRLQFVTYAIVDKKLGPIGALKYSWAVTKGQFWRLSVFNLVNGLVMILGILALGIGIIVAIPVTSLATAFVYRKLSVNSAGPDSAPLPQPAAAALPY